MSNETSSTADDKADPGSGADKADPARASDKAKEHMIPKARFDEESGKRKAMETELGEFADKLVAELPDAVKELLPDGLNAMARLKWWLKAKGSSAAKYQAQVPETDKGKPKSTPKDRDLSTLPPVARMAAAYGKKAS